MASADLIWECVKKNSCFIRTSRNAPKFSAEPGNLTGLHSLKYSGLANQKVVGLDVRCKGKKESIILTTRSLKAEKASQPRKLLHQAGIKKCAKKGEEQLKKVLGVRLYRQDLLPLALAKYRKIRLSFKKKARVVKSRRAQK